MEPCLRYHDSSQFENVSPGVILLTCNTGLTRVLFKFAYVTTRNIEIPITKAWKISHRPKASTFPITFFQGLSLGFKRLKINFDRKRQLSW